MAPAPLHHLQHHLGGFADDELRKILVQAGALRFTDGHDEDVWGLLERKREQLGKQTANSRA